MRSGVLDEYMVRDTAAVVDLQAFTFGPSTDCGATQPSGTRASFLGYVTGMGGIVSQYHFELLPVLSTEINMVGVVI